MLARYTTWCTIDNASQMCSREKCNILPRPSQEISTCTLLLISIAHFCICTFLQRKCVSKNCNILPRQSGDQQLHLIYCAFAPFPCNAMKEAPYPNQTIWMRSYIIRPYIGPCCFDIYSPRNERSSIHYIRTMYHTSCERQLLLIPWFAPTAL